MTENQQQSTQFIESQTRRHPHRQRARSHRAPGRSRDWHYAFTTLARQGRALGIRFGTARTRSIHLRRLFER